MFVQIGWKTQKLSFHFWLGLVGRAGMSKNGRRHFKLILCYFWAINSPHTKFHQNPMKNAEVEKDFFDIDGLIIFYCITYDIKLQKETNYKMWSTWHILRTKSEAKRAQIDFFLSPFVSLNWLLENEINSQMVTPFYPLILSTQQIEKSQTTSIYDPNE